MRITQQASAARDKLLDDLKTVISDAEQLLSDTEQQLEYGHKSAVAQLERKLRISKAELARLERRVTASSKKAVQITGQFVEDHPWQAAGAGLCAGVCTGLLVSLLVGRS